MQVASITNGLGFNGNEPHKRLPQRRHVDSIINLDDNSVKKLAYLTTMNRFDEAKYKRQNNLMLGFIPVTAGVAGMLFPLKFNKLSGAANRVMSGASRFGSWAGLLALGGLVGAGVNKLAKNSESYRDFDQKHGFLSFMTTAAVIVGALFGIRKGISAVVAKPRVNKAILSAFDKYGKKFNNNKLVTKLSNWASKKSAKMPGAFKDFVKLTAGVSPVALLVGSFLHSHNTKKALNNDIAKNYSELKNEQINLAQKRVRELAVQRDFLLQNNEVNQEELGEFMHALRQGRALENRQRA